ncbi:hypothetical protein ACCQ05_07590 [Xanthomonas sp. NCPPB 3582]|uniref:hypothetical protein n=1 Tax=Xanthomonas sp. NCPPB 3582 TaxID=487557 RepID=UPI003556B72A
MYYFDRYDRIWKILRRHLCEKLRMHRTNLHANHKLRDVSRRRRTSRALQAMISPSLIEALTLQMHRQHRLRRGAQGSRRTI